MTRPFVRAKRPAPSRLPVLALIAAGLLSGACKKDGFGGNKTPQPVTKKPLAPPPEVKPPPKAPPAPPPVEGPAVVLELQPAPPEAWWNSCVKVTYKGQSFDAGCSKTTGLKSIVIPVEKGETCASLTFEITTFKNQGSACVERMRAGQTCEGPYGDTPDFTRVSSEADARNFQWLSEPPKPDSWLRFEDQPSENIDAVAADPSRASELGIDYNDIVLRIVPKEVAVEVKQGSKSSAAGTPAGCR